MVYMLIRTALWGLAIIAAALAFVWLKDSDGGVTLALAGRVYGPFRPVEAVGIILGLAFALWLMVKAFGFLVALVRFFTGDETALSRFWNRSRERRGFNALAGGLISMAEGDGKTALVKARKAERLLDRPVLTRLVVAQTAEAAGQIGLAKDYYKQLAAEPRTAYVGVKGLLDQAIRKGDKTKALALAQHAFGLKAREPELLVTLFDLQCEAGDWDGARRTLEAKTKAGAITRDVAERRAAVLMVADGRAAATKGETGKSRDLIGAAHKKAPGLIPASITLAGQQHADGSTRKAEKTLREAWRREPHPDIAAAYAALAPEESPEARRKRFRELTRLHPDHAETRMLSAELALAAGDAAGGRAAMGDLAESHPTGRALALMAAIERADGGGDALVRGWLARAVSAPRAAQWTCANCGGRHNEWTPVCRRCEAFDTLAWAEGDAETAESEAGAALLPIIAEDAPAEAPEADAEGPDEAKEAAAETPPEGART
ncbi:MAG: heme biosynthesis protein HemY [Pikeienuella sp.]